MLKKIIWSGILFIALVGLSRFYSISAGSVVYASGRMLITPTPTGEATQQASSPLLGIWHYTITDADDRREAIFQFYPDGTLDFTLITEGELDSLSGTFEFFAQSGRLVIETANEPPDFLQLEFSSNGNAMIVDGLDPDQSVLLRRIDADQLSALMTLATPEPTATPGATPTPAPELQSSETSLTDQISIGGQVKVSGTNGVGIALRAGPGRNTRRVGIAPEDEETILTVLDGPRPDENQEDFIWWQVRLPDGTEGWMVADFLEPLAEIAESKPAAVEQKLTLPGGDPPTLDPHLGGDATSSAYLVELYSGLVTYDLDLNLIPDLAESWQISEDSTVYTFALNQQATFHNGKPVRAQDFKWSFERACDFRTGSPTADTYLGDIVGCRDKLQGRADQVEGVQVIDDHTLQITIDAPKTYFLAKLTYPTAFVLDRENVERGGRRWTTTPNGTGPFKLAAFHVGESLILVKNERYYREPVPQLDQIHVTLSGGSAMIRYENGDLDITPVGLNDLERVTDPTNPLNDELIVGTQLSVFYLGLNLNQPPFDDIKVRQAFSLALDKDKIISIVYRETIPVAHGIVPPGVPGYSHPDLIPTEYDPDEALALIAASTYGDVTALPEITLHVSGAGGSPARITEAIVASWKDTLGIDIAIQQTDWSTFLADIYQDENPYQMYQLGWIADYPDPQNFLDSLFHSQNRQNHSGYHNPAVDILLDEAAVETDQVKRQQLYRQVEQVIIDEVPLIPLYFDVEHWLVKPDVNNFHITPLIVPKYQYVYRGDSANLVASTPETGLSFAGLFTGTIFGDNDTEAALNLDLARADNQVSGIALIGSGGKIALSGLLCPVEETDLPAGTIELSGTLDPDDPHQLSSSSSIEIQRIEINVVITATLADDGQTIDGLLTIYTPPVCNNPELPFALQRVNRGLESTSSPTDTLSTHLPPPQTVEMLEDRPLRIGYMVLQNEDWDIYVANIDGSEATNVSNSPGFDGFPGWSSIAKRLTWVTDRFGPGAEIVIANMDDSQVVNISDAVDTDDVLPVWSPNGQLLAYVSNRYGDSEVLVSALDGSTVNVSNHEAEDVFFAWSPTCATLETGDDWTDCLILFGSTRHLDADNTSKEYIPYLISADGQNLSLVADAQLQVLEAIFSPNGSQIAYLKQEAGVANLFLLDLNTQEEIRLTNDEIGKTNIAWSPTGALIGYVGLVGEDQDTNDIYTVSVADRTITRLTDVVERDALNGDFAWSPDGGQILFSTLRDGNPEIYVMNADGRNPTNLTNTPQLVEIEAFWIE